MLDLLKGVRVVESAMLFTGDHLGTMLGDLGADVIKVERPPDGDYLRDFLGQITPHNSPAHLQVNKNKRSVRLDLRQPRGLEVFWDLLATADVFIDGSAGDAATKLGIGYDAQRERRPEIVYCQVSGYGARGPYSQIPTHGEMMNALSAGIPQRVDSDGLCRRDPSVLTNFRSVGLAAEATSVAGVWGAFLVAAALRRREVTGQGCHLDVAASDAVLAAGWIGACYSTNWDRITDHVGMPSVAEQAKYQYYETRDGRLVLFCAIECKFWENFCRASGREDLRRFGGSGGPVDFAADDGLRRELAELFRTRTQAEWVSLAAEHDIALGPAYNDVTEAATDPHVIERGILHHDVHPDAGEFTYVGQPALVDGHQFAVHRHAPALGQHTAEVLSSLGYDDAAIQDLTSAGLL